MRVVSDNVTVLPVSPNQYTVTAETGVPAAARKTRKKRILMIEDDRDMSDLIQRTLKARFHCEVDVAQDPFDAINRMIDKFYDLIILDWQLPGLNGTETLVEAEKGLRFDPDIPIQWDTKKAPVVIFSSQKKSDCLPRRTKHFNYIGFISKMQSLPDILQAFAQYLEAAENTAATSPVTRRAAN